jgi:hypothetical protein
MTREEFAQWRTPHHGPISTAGADQIRKIKKLAPKKTLVKAAR